MKDKYLIDFVTRKKGHFVYFDVDKESMNYITNLLLENDKYSMNCFINFSTADEECLNQIYRKCNNEFQYDLIARLYVGGKVIKNLLNKANERNGELYKHICKVETMFKNADLKEILISPSCNLVNFDTINELHKKHSLDVNFYLKDVEDKNLQHAINDFISYTHSQSLKVFTNKTELCSLRTSTGLTIDDKDFVVEDIYPLKCHQVEF